MMGSVKVLGPLLIILLHYTDVCIFKIIKGLRIKNTCDKGLMFFFNKLNYKFLVTQWFQSNNMKLNQRKCNFLTSGYKHENRKNQKRKNMKKRKIKIPWYRN